MDFIRRKFFFVCLWMQIGFGGISQVRIVCMGNSITQGKVNPKSDSIVEKSYRPWLWQKLLAAGIDVDMVGYNRFYFLEDSVHRPQPPLRFKEREFDNDNEAYYGITSENFLHGSSSSGWTGKPLPSLNNRLDDSERGYTPDVALLHIGTNDADSLVSQSVQNLASIIDVLGNKNRQVVVFLAKLITGWKAINQHIDSLANAKASKESPVIVVDMTTGFVNDPKSPDTDTFDWVHPNEKGQQFMAQRWFAAIMTYLQSHKTDVRWKKKMNNN